MGLLLYQCIVKLRFYILKFNYLLNILLGMELKCFEYLAPLPDCFFFVHMIYFPCTYVKIRLASFWYSKNLMCNCDEIQQKCWNIINVSINLEL